MPPPTIKTVGYIISSASVLLLGTVSYKAAKSDQTLMVMLIAGVTASLVGMGLRWLSYEIDKRK
jgi:hypothetical protein